MNENEARKKLHAAIQLMARRNDVIQDTHGNVSVRVDAKHFPPPTVLIKPSGVPYDKIREKDICHAYVHKDAGVVWTGTSKQKLLTPSVDTVHHVAIYRENPHIRAICHTHSPHVVAYAIAGRDIKCHCTEHADYFGHDVRCLPYQDLNSWGERVDVQLHEKAVLLGKHGGLTFGRDPVEAVNLAIQLENVARKTFLAYQITDPWQHNVDTMLPEETEKWHVRYQTNYGQR